MVSIIYAEGLLVLQDKEERKKKKYLLEGDIESLKTDKPDFFKQIDTVIKESKDYELMIDINSKTFGIVNGEYKKPLGQLKKAEFILFEMMIKG